MAETVDSVSLTLDQHNQVVVNLFGGTVTSWIQNGSEVIFVSKNAIFNNKKAIRGGIPVVFPQFGPWDLGPQHGFARITKWEVAVSPEKTGDSVRAVFRLSDSEDTRKMWQGHQFDLLYTVTLTTNSLQTDLTVNNKGASPFSFTWLLHTYFKLENISNTSISGLKDLVFIDKTRGGEEFQEKEELVHITGFTDRVYKKANGPHLITGIAGGRTARVEKRDFYDTVVWNPWEENAKKMADFGDDEYPYMVCVEAGCVVDPVVVSPGKQFQSSQIIQIV